MPANGLLSTQTPPLKLYPRGVLHRRIGIATQPGEARVALEDDFHHFRITLRHQGGVVTAAFAVTLRHPNALCPSASARLTELVGMGLSLSAAAVLQHTDARQQCTHMIDMAGLAVAAAARGTPRRVYTAQVPDRVNGRTTATLWRDGAQVLHWALDRGHIAAPPPFTGLDVGAGFTGWVAANLPDDEAEAALVLRRAVFIANGRRYDLDREEFLGTGPLGGCWAWQPERAGLATRVVGSTLEFTGRAELLTQDDAAWLDFSV